MLIFGCCIVHPSVMFKRTIIETSLCYSYPHAEDYALWVHIAQKYKITNIPEILFKYRRTGSQVSSKYAEEQLQTTLKIQLEQINALGIEPTEEERHLHWAVGCSQFTSSISFANSVFLWLSKLKEANFLTHYYPEPAFTSLLRIFWNGGCQKLVEYF